MLEPPEELLDVEDEHFVTVIMRMAPDEADLLREVQERVSHGPITVQIIADPTEYGGKPTYAMAEVHTIGSLPEVEERPRPRAIAEHDVLNWPPDMRRHLMNQHGMRASEIGEGVSYAGLLDEHEKQHPDEVIQYDSLAPGVVPVKCDCGEKPHSPFCMSRPSGG